MNNKNKNPHWTATTSSSGSISINLIIPEEVRKDLTKDQKEEILTRTITTLQKKLTEEGRIDFMSSQDLANKYGSTRQYWDKLMKEKKIAYIQTSAGKITTNLWAKGFIEGGDEYVKQMQEARKQILQKYENEKVESGSITCPKCKTENSLSYYYNNGLHINGLCRKCGFQIDSVAQNQSIDT